MKRYQRAIRALSLVAGFLLLTGFAELAQTQMEGTKYPEPRYPSYLKPPKSIDDVLPYTRAILRNKSGIQGHGMGILEPGDKVLVVAPSSSDEIILEGLVKAGAERNITLDMKYDYELVGLTRQDVQDLRDHRRKADPGLGYDMEVVGWVENTIPNSEAAKQWLKGRDPELAKIAFPEARELPERLEAVDAKMDSPNVGAGIKKYLTEHPDYRGVFWAAGGTTGRRRELYPMQSKYLGTMWMFNRWAAMSKIGEYPADVWMLTEEQTMEPLAHVERIEITDPEGTNVWADLTEDMAARWVQGAYQRGHIYMFPNQATGRFGYSVVDYPAFQSEWLPREPIARIEGVIAGTKAGGFFPRWEVHFKNGFITEVKGGGKYGELFRHFLKYPGTENLTYPYHETPGFWYLYEIAWGTHPKYYRAPGVSDRLVAGVYHWGLGVRVRHDPSAPKDSEEWARFTKEHNVPLDHNFHTRTFFNTYKVRIRGADRWVTLCDKGRMASLDNPEVRALASRYGNPDQILANDWIDKIPGINAPGDYMKDYASEPWKSDKKVMDEVEAGTYEYFYPKN